MANSDGDVYEYDGHVLPPPFKRKMTPEILKEKEENHKKVEKRKIEFIKKNRKNI